VRIAIRVKPGSTRTAVGGGHGDALIVSVTARAVDGKATEAALRAIAEAFGVRRRDVSLVIGATSRNKVVEIAGEDARLTGRRDILRGSAVHKMAAMDPSALDSQEPAVVTDNEAQLRFEIRVGGELAGFVGYILNGSLIDLVHTEIDPRFRGGGLGGQLVRASLDSARDRGLAVLPTCPFIRSWIRKHPDYKDLVPEDRRSTRLKP
jgi:uncharacterized protein (TIGR00251 family)